MTPDRLAAAVAQGHEDAVQAWPQEDGVRDPDDHGPGCGCVGCYLTYPAPVSPPAGEDVERLAEVARNHARGAPSNGTEADHWRGIVRAVLAALSARPVEAQEVDNGEVRCDVLAHHAEIPVRRAEVAALRLDRAELADEVHKLRERVARIPDRLQRAEQQVADLRAEVERRGGVVREGAALVQAALARAEAAEAVIEKVRALADEWERRSRMGDRTKIAPAMAANALRALLDGDSEGRES